MPTPSPDELGARRLVGARRALARLLTLIEDGAEEVLRAVVRRLHSHTGRAQLIGVTGSPGVGKSTLTSALVAVWRRRRRSVAVLAVDPSSPFSGGALLGDRVRMQDHVMDEGVYVRSMASRGQLGGLSWAAPQGLAVLDAAGFDVVVAETVGVGQAEVEVASTMDSTLVVVAPGMGDSIQAAKAGILEVADVFCVNKADREGADRTVRELRDMLALGHADWQVPICRTVAAADEGIEELADALDAHLAWLEESGTRRARSRDRARGQIREIALREMRRRLGAGAPEEGIEALVDEVAARQLDPYAAADRLLEVLEPHPAAE